MARLAGEEWDKLKADWCTGHYTHRELGERYGVSNVAITKKAKAENWEKLKKEIVQEYIDSRIKTRQEVAKVSEVTKVSSANLSASLDRVADDKARFNEVGVEIIERISELVGIATSGNEIKDLAVAHKSIYEPRFKAAPDTAIQINNSNTNAETTPTLDITKLSSEARRELLAARIDATD